MNTFSFDNLKRDLPAGLVVFLVAVPLCLGIALASGAPLFSGIISGIVGGLVVGSLSGSHISVSGPAAGLSAIVLSSIATMGSFDAFLAAVVLAGILQIIMGYAKAGIIADYFPSNVIKGLLAAIGIILIMKQIPHAIGYDADAEGDFSFLQRDEHNTFSQLLYGLNKIAPGAAIIGLLSVALLVWWEKSPLKKFQYLPAPLVVVVLGIIMNEVFNSWFSAFTLSGDHLVSLPVSSDLSGFFHQFTMPDFSALMKPQTYMVGVTLAIVASLETLLNLEATDKMDPLKRHSPPNRELLAQGIGNITSGLIGGIPLTSVIVRSSVNVNAGARTKLSAIVHGVIMLISAISIPWLLNKIPLASLAGILLVTGFKLAKPTLFVGEYKKGWNQFLPFMATILAIVFTDLLLGIIVGLSVSILFILRSNYSNPFEFIREKYHANEVIRINLAQQVSFLNKASLIEMLNSLPNGAQVIIDAVDSDYIDYDVLEILQDFKSVQAPSRNIELSLLGFKEQYQLENHIRFTTTVTKEIQQRLRPQEVLNLLKEGNKRFIQNQRVNRDFMQQVHQTSEGQHPIAAILGCIDSRTTSELIFDLGLGDIFSVRVAGNIANDDILGSLEFACKVAGAKLIVILGHTNCGAIKAACDGVKLGNLSRLLDKIQPAVTAETLTQHERHSANHDFVHNVTYLNVEYTRRSILQQSEILADMAEKQEIIIIGAIYDVATGKVSFEESGARLLYSDSEVAA